MKAIIYARSATNKVAEEFNSVEHQLARLQLHCKKLKHQITGVYCDVGYGSDFNRPGWESLMKDLENRTIIADAIICTSTDRLSRTKTGAMVVLERLRLYEINVKFIDKPYDIWIELKKIRKPNRNLSDKCKQLSIQE